MGRCYEKVNDTIINQFRLLPDNPDKSFAKYRATS